MSVAVVGDRCDEANPVPPLPTVLYTLIRGLCGATRALLHPCPDEGLVVALSSSNRRRRQLVRISPGGFQSICRDLTGFVFAQNLRTQGEIVGVVADGHARVPHHDAERHCVRHLLRVDPRPMEGAAGPPHGLSRTPG
eukprot:1182478-Prorocentrum_minimum.AAC.1